MFKVFEVHKIRNNKKFINGVSYLSVVKMVKSISIRKLAEQYGINKLVKQHPDLSAFLVILTSWEQDQKENMEELKHIAEYDGLTGLMRKEILYPVLEEIIALTNLGYDNLSVAMIDMDNFKRYNDNYGHIQGDEALKTLGAIIKDTIREGDIAARYGGEEFCVVLPKTDEKGLVNLIEKLRSNVEKTVIGIARVEDKKTGEYKALKKSEDYPDEGYKHITVSIGGLTYSPGLRAVLGLLGDYKKDASKVLIDIADKALYDAKKSGKNRIQIAKIE